MSRKENRWDIDINENDIKKLDQKMKLFQYLIIKNQREEYISELKKVKILIK